MSIFNFFKRKPAAPKASAQGPEYEALENLVKKLREDLNNPPTPTLEDRVGKEQQIAKVEGKPKADVSGYPPEAMFTVGFITQAAVSVHPVETFTERVHEALVKANSRNMGEVLNSIYYPQPDGSLLRTLEESGDTPETTGKPRSKRNLQ